MIITYHGVDFFKVSQGDTTIAINPVSKDSKIKSTRFGADITLISTNDTEHNGSDVTSRGEKESFVISGPGEYEIGGVFIHGFLSKALGEKVNTIYTIDMEGMRLCFMGALADSKISSEAKEAIEGIDILFVPIGDSGVLDPSAAHKLAVQFEPKIIIPAHYGDVGVQNALKTFLKEAGEENAERADKLTIKKKDLDGREGDVIVLEQI